MKTLHQFLDEYSKSYFQCSWVDMFNTGNTSQVGKVMERALEEYLKQERGNDAELIKKFSDVRTAQKKYFKNRSDQNLRHAKWWEKHIDELLKEQTGREQLKLF